MPPVHSGDLVRTWGFIPLKKWAFGLANIPQCVVREGLGTPAPFSHDQDVLGCTCAVTRTEYDLRGSRSRSRAWPPSWRTKDGSNDSWLLTQACMHASYCNLNPGDLRIQDFLGVAQRRRFPAFQELFWHVAVDAAATAKALAALDLRERQQHMAAVVEAHAQRASTAEWQAVRPSHGALEGGSTYRGLPDAYIK